VVCLTPPLRPLMNSIRSENDRPRPSNAQSLLQRVSRVPQTHVSVLPLLDANVTKSMPGINSAGSLARVNLYHAAEDGGTTETKGSVLPSDLGRVSVKHLHDSNLTHSDLSINDLSQIALAGLARASAASPVEVRSILESLKSVDGLVLNVSKLVDGMMHYGAALSPTATSECDNSKSWLPCIWKRTLQLAAGFSEVKGARNPSSVAAAIPLRTMMQCAYRVATGTH